MVPPLVSKLKMNVELSRKNSISSPSLLYRKHVPFIGFPSKPLAVHTEYQQCRALNEWQLDHLYKREHFAF